MSYAVIRIGGKQYRVSEGQRLLVDRLPQDEGKTFHPEILLVAGDGSTELKPQGVTVTARVVGHVLGEKVRIGKYRRRTGYKRHNGYRSRLSRIEIESVGAKAARETKPKAQAAADDQATTEVTAKAAPAPAKAKATTKPAGEKPAAAKPAAAKATATKDAKPRETKPKVSDEEKPAARKPAAKKKEQ
jgi:large subunit ribosomal protein L21